MSTKTAFVKDDEGLYRVKGKVSSDEIIKTATQILFDEVSGRERLSGAHDTAHFLQLALAPEQNEYFAVLYLDNQNQVISFEKVFNGSIDCSAVYPRVVVQKCLEQNAAAVIFAHNHPSGTHKPSTSDELITKRLKEALALIDIRVLDHFVVSGSGWTSLAQQGVI